MGNPTEPGPVKFFVALLANREEMLSSARIDLAALLGPADTASAVLPWKVTDYYEKEMGPGLLRQFVSFAHLGSPGDLGQIKLSTQGLEERYLREDGEVKRRQINIDPGYLDAGKVVLASTKGAAHRIYLHSGIYAESTLLYHGGSFQSFPYTYRDYLWPETLSFFAALRSLYLKQLRQ